jgi:hypothetical protein
MGVQELQVERDLDDEVDEDRVLNYEEKSGHFRSVSCVPRFKFALVSEVRLHGRSIERKLINKDNNLTLKTHTK